MDELIKKEIKLVNEKLSNSYAPYSKFRVSALLVTDDDKYIYGVNVENSAYGSTICAERNALTTYVTEGYTYGRIKRFYISSSSEDITLPCGSCLQFLNEFVSEDADIILTNYKGEYKKYKLIDLLPHGFGNKNLGV